MLPVPALDRGRRVLLWDAENSSTIVLASAFRRLGWSVGWIALSRSLSRHAARDGEPLALEGSNDSGLLALASGDYDALTLHGDDQVRAILRSWHLLSPAREFLPDREALEIALSKEQSLEVAKRLGIPVLPTEIAGTPAEAARLGIRLARGARVVLKADGGSAGSAVVLAKAGAVPDPVTWAALTRHSPRVLVQRAIRGPRVLVTVVYDRGRERAAVVHEKLRAWPATFGVTAIGVTRRVDEAHAYAERFFFTLGWHGFANLELRQDLDDRRWYFMEVNPRVPSSVGIQEAAGSDLAATWAAICGGDGIAWPGRSYREGVRFTWGVPTLALALTAPWSVPVWSAGRLLRGGDDLRGESAGLHLHAMRVARWKAVNERR